MPVCYPNHAAKCDNQVILCKQVAKAETQTHNERTGSLSTTTATCMSMVPLSKEFIKAV